MKKIFLILIVFTLVLFSCETDFDVNAEWQETTVVFGLLDNAKDIQYVKINKAFLGEGDALEMASISDSVNFNTNNIKVKMHEVVFSDTNWSINLTDTILDKDNGLFGTDNNIVYYFKTSDISFNNNKKYVLTIENNESDSFVSAETEVITNFSFMNFNPAYKFGFYNPNAALSDSAKYRSKTIEWNKSKNGEIYQLDIRFNYLEDGDLRYLIWSQPLVSYDGNSNMLAKLEGRKFFNFLSTNIPNDVKVRSFVNIDLIMTVGTINLYNYIKVNEPVTGIVQQRPQFTNINNGIGMFTSRYTHTQFAIGLTNDTQDYLINQLDRNFQ